VGEPSCLARHRPALRATHAHQDEQLGPHTAGDDRIAAMPNRAAIHPINTERCDIADFTPVNSFNCFDVRSLVAALGAGGDFESFFLGLFGGSIHVADAGPIYRDGFLREYIFER